MYELRRLLRIILRQECTLRINELAVDSLELGQHGDRDKLTIEARPNSMEWTVQRPRIYEVPRGRPVKFPKCSTIAPLTTQSITSYTPSISQ